MANNEGVIQALHEFENMTDADKVLTQELEDLFVQIAHTGRTQIPWVYLKPVFMFKMDKVMRDFFESSPSRNSNSTEPTNNAEFDVMRQRLLDCIESFTSAPFTIQRLCELMVEPKRHYRCSEKFMRGIEKNVLVVSTMTENGEEELSNNIEGNHDNHDTTNIANGPVTNGIITTACPTEMQSVDSRDSDGANLQHFPETHYPTEEELQKCQESHSIENKQLEEEEEEETKTEDKEEEECTPNEKEATQNSSDETNDSSESKELETEIQEHKEKDNKSEEKLLEEKTELEEVPEEKEKCDAEKEGINENTAEEEKSSDNCDESKKESHIVEDNKETESQQESSTTSSADQDIDEPMEE